MIVKEREKHPETKAGLLKFIKYLYNNHTAQSLCLLFIFSNSRWFRHEAFRRQATKVLS